VWICVRLRPVRPDQRRIACPARVSLPTVFVPGLASSWHAAERVRAPPPRKAQNVHYLDPVDRQQGPRAVSVVAVIVDVLRWGGLPPHSPSIKCCLLDGEPLSERAWW
jgi:hypothetical protein